MTDSAQRLGWPSDGEMLDLLIASGYDAEQVHPACYRAFGWKTFTEKLKAALRSSALPEPCEYCGGGKRTGLPGNACENCMNTGLKYPEHAVRSHDLYKGLDDALVALHGLLDFPGDRESWDEAKATYSRLQPLLNDDEPVPSALPETDVMRSAARAKDIVSGWSDAKRNYADRVTAPSALLETGESNAIAADAKRYSDLAGEFGSELMAAQKALRKILGQAHAGAMLGGDNAYQACLTIEGIIAGLSATLSALPETGERDVRWAVNVLLEKIAEKFEGWETFDIWRSDAAMVVRGFKHDTAPLRPSPDGAVRFHRSTEVSDAPIGQASAEDDAP
jgi:hypothetical protein